MEGKAGIRGGRAGGVQADEEVVGPGGGDGVQGVPREVLLSSIGDRAPLHRHRLPPGALRPLWEAVALPRFERLLQAVQLEGLVT